MNISIKCEVPVNAQCPLATVNDHTSYVLAALCRSNISIKSDNHMAIH